MRSISQVLKKVPASLDAGLSPAAVDDSRQRFASNRLTPLPREPIWRKFLEKFDEPIIKILLAAALLSIVVELFKQDTALGGAAFGAVAVALALLTLVKPLRRWLPATMFGLAIALAMLGAVSGHPSYEGLAVMVAVVLATGVAFASEYKSDREFEALNAHKDEVVVKLIRGGVFHTAPLERVVVGDLVTLEAGDEIPADGRLVKATDLLVDQSLMTGESEPVEKRTVDPDATADGPEQLDCLYRGTQVVDGIGLLLVADVGDATMIGQIAQRLSADTGEEHEGAPDTEQQRVQRKLTISKELTPLQQKLADLARLISKVGYLAAGLIFAALLVRGVLRDEFTKGWLDAANYLIESIVYTVIIIVVAVPEGLPMSVTVSLALAMRKMTRANSLVRQLVACETIGSATVICSDKTGTMTQNRMQVVRIGWDGQVFDKNSPGWLAPAAGPAANSVRPVDLLALNAAVNSTANLEEKESGRIVPVGNSTEGALLLWLHAAGLVYQTLRLKFPPLYQLHFSSERKHMTTVVRADGGLLALSKGAPEIVLDMTTHYLSADGTVTPWTEPAKQDLRDALNAASAQAMRALAFASKRLPEGDNLHERKVELDSGFTFTGFVAIRDPLRDDVKDAVRHCRQAGIDVKMITGDNIETARAIAGEIGLLDRPDAAVLTHDEYTALTDNQLTEMLPRLRVLARARPMDKLRLVTLLQQQQQVVAMTGDGTNDAPALRRADVGLAMGIAGTEVAKEASKIVLLDDSFATIVKAVHWGRSLYENIQRFIQFQLTVNVSALTIAFLGPFLNVRPPFTVLQLLWINVIMDTFAAIALCSEPPRAGLMLLPPKRRDENILTPMMKRSIFLTAGFFVLAMLGLLLGMKFAGWFKAGSGPDPEGWNLAPLNVRQVSIFFTVYVLFQMWNQINCRSLTPERSGLAGLFRNPAFLAIASLTLLGQIMIITFGGAIFKVEPLSLMDWLLIAGGTASVLVFGELTRLVRGRMTN